MKRGFEMTDEELAEAHATWYAQLSKRIYKEAFKHGYKHGKEAKE